MDVYCPACNKPTEPTERGGVAIDVCPFCQGIWCDGGELRTVVYALAADPATEQDALYAEARKVITEQQIVQRGLFCPHDGQMMETFNYAYNSNVLLDRCPLCKGVWIDGDKMPALGQYIKGNPLQKELGHAIAQHVRERTNVQDTLEESSILGARVPLSYVRVPGALWILPVADDEPTNRFPFLTFGLIVANILVFYLIGLEVVGFYSLALMPRMIVNGGGLLGLLTHMFTHAGLMHLLFNMLFLWVLGNNIEERLGRVWFVPFYLVCGAVAGIAQTATQAALELDLTIPMIGASGAVAGLMGAYLVFYPRARLRIVFLYRLWNIPAVLYLSVWFIDPSSWR